MNVGSSHYQGDLYIDLASRWVRKATMYELPDPPVWDGMAAGYGRLFVSTGNGRIVCLSGRPQEGQTPVTVAGRYEQDPVGLGWALSENRRAVPDREEIQ